MSKPLTLIINQMLDSGIFPSELKNPSTLYKKGDVNTLNKYRPTSLVPALSKIFEWIIYYHNEILS